MPIHPNATFTDLTTWLDEKLVDQNSFTPRTDVIPNITTKGIYFWFMHPEGYAKLSEFVTITPIEPSYKRTINEVVYDLVYLGTAGTGKKGNSNLEKRFRWHINQNHSNSSICHGTLSTLRVGLGALLSDDLIIPNTEEEVNDFMSEYLKIFWVEYTDDKSLIDSDEHLLIKGVKPLLNLKNNPIARANSVANSTKLYKLRRSIVYSNTRSRINCSDESERTMKTSNNINIPIDAPSYEHQLLEENINEGCVEFFVLKHQNITKVIRGIDGLPAGKCTFKIYDSANPTTILFPTWKTTGSKIHTNPDAQNIYTYFANIDGKNGQRWEIIQNHMIENNIDEITVKVCAIKSDSSMTNDTQKTKIPKPKKMSKNSNQGKTKISKSLFLIPCSSSKIPKSDLKKRQFKIEKLEFNKELGEHRKKLLEIISNQQTVHQRKKNKTVFRINNNLDLKHTETSNKLYSKGRFYISQASDSINWSEEDQSKIYILSALFGIIRADNYIPLYDLAMTDEINGCKNFAQKFWKGKLNVVIEQLLNNGNEVYNLLSNGYSKVVDKKTLTNLIIPNIELTKNDRSNVPGKKGKWLKNYLKNE